MPNSSERIEQLRREIEEHNRRYYEDAAPTITDAAYDALFHELRSLEEKHRTLPRTDTVADVVDAIRRRYDLVSDAEEASDAAGAGGEVPVRRELPLR